MFKKKKKVGLEQPKLTCEGEKKKKKNQSRTRKKNLEGRETQRPEQ